MSEWGKKGNLSIFEHGMVVGARRCVDGVKREKHPVCGSPVGQNALLMLEVRAEWAD